MMSTAQRAKLKQAPKLYSLTVKIDANSRAVAKVVSAAEYLGVPAADIWPLYAALDGLLHERRELRAAMWREFAKAVQGHG